MIYSPPLDLLVPEKHILQTTTIGLGIFLKLFFQNPLNDTIAQKIHVCGSVGP